MANSTPEGNGSSETPSSTADTGSDGNYELEYKAANDAYTPDSTHSNTESITSESDNTSLTVAAQDDSSKVTIHEDNEADDNTLLHHSDKVVPDRDKSISFNNILADKEIDENHSEELADDSDSSKTENAHVVDTSDTHEDSVQLNEDVAAKNDDSNNSDSSDAHIKDIDIEVSYANSDDEEIKKLNDDSPAVSEVGQIAATVSHEPSVEESVFAEHLAQGQKRQRRITRYWMLSAALLFLLLAAILTPLIVLVSYGVNAYATYNLLRAHAYGGIGHLQSIKTIFTQTPAHSTSTNLFDETKLQKADQELVAAHDDFVQVQSIIKNTPLIHTVTYYIPQYRPQVESVQAASQMVIDATLIGEQVLAVALKMAPNLQGPLLSSASTPLLTPTDIDLISHMIDNITPLFNNIQAQSRNISLNALPISSSQRTQIEQVLQLMPQIQTLLQHGRELLAPISWLLGVGEPRTFLVQTMDRAELRATGGFTGQYGELSINSGRVAPFSLHDISNIEYAANSPNAGKSPPSIYDSWWPFANWGLRDSNLSADFPTSARIAIAEYKAEVNRNVDGVITFSPFFIEHILQAIGPLQIPRYNETVTAQNLEGLLHYYQLDNAGIRKIELVEHITNGTDVRKYFTSEVAKVLMDRVRHASPTELLALGTQMLQDLKTRDLQVYFTDPDVENLLTQYGYDASMDRSNTHDGLYIVQMNVSASKASQYVQTNMEDTVKLDTNGGATHTLVMHLIYNQIGPVYGLDTYRDYIRIYVPQSAHLLSGDGFDIGQPLCGGPFAACSPYGIYPHQEMVCPVGQYNAGASAPMIGDPYTQEWHPLDQIGAPNNTTSDEPGKAMFGGYVVIPKNCSMTVTVSWYVPSLSHSNYDLLFQRQSSTFPSLDLTVIPTAKTCFSNNNDLHFNGIIASDTSFSLDSPSSAHTSSGSCSLVTSS